MKILQLLKLQICFLSLIAVFTWAGVNSISFSQDELLFDAPVSTDPVTDMSPPEIPVDADIPLPEPEESSSPIADGPAVDADIPLPEPEESSSPVEDLATEEPVEGSVEDSPEEPCEFCNCDLSTPNDIDSIITSISDIDNTDDDLKNITNIDELANVCDAAAKDTLSAKTAFKARIQEKKILAKKHILMHKIDKDIKAIKKGKKGKYLKAFKNEGNGKIIITLHEKKKKGKKDKSGKSKVIKFQVVCTGPVCPDNANRCANSCQKCVNENSCETNTPTALCSKPDNSECDSNPKGSRCLLGTCRCGCSNNLIRPLSSAASPVASLDCPVGNQQYCFVNRCTECISQPFGPGNDYCLVPAAVPGTSVPFYNSIISNANYGQCSSTSSPIGNGTQFPSYLRIWKTGCPASSPVCLSYTDQSTNECVQCATKNDCIALGLNGQVCQLSTHTCRSCNNDNECRTIYGTGKRCIGGRCQ